MVKAGDNFIYNAFIGDKPVSELYYGSDCIWPGPGMTRFLLGDGAVKNAWPIGVLAQGDVPADVVSAYVGDLVTSIGDNAFDGRGGLSAVDIPQTVESINNSAFAGCSSLSGVSLPSGLTSVGNYAFHNCTSLSGVALPDGLVNIWWAAFEHCDGLSSIEVPASVQRFDNYAFANCENLASASVSCASTGANMFDGCHKLSSVSLADGVTTIAGSTFANSGVEGVVVRIPDSVAAIGEWAFYNSKYAIFDFGNTRQTVPQLGNAAAFQYCVPDMTILVPDALYDTWIEATNWSDDIVRPHIVKYSDITRIIYSGDEEKLVMFKGATTDTLQRKEYVKGAKIGGAVSKIGGSTFYGCYNMKYVEMPDHISSIDQYAFAACENLSSITIPNSVSSIGPFAFNKCYRITDVVIPEGVTSIGKTTFNVCSSLTSLTFPTTLTSIGETAFKNCRSLPSVSLPDALQVINNNAFSTCTSCAVYDFGNTRTTIPQLKNAGVFEQCRPDMLILVPDDLYDTWIDATNWSDDSVKPHIVKWSDVTRTTYDDGLTSQVYASGTLSQNSIPNSMHAADVKIGGAVTQIGQDAFKYVKTLSSVYIPNSVTAIGGWAFFQNEALVSADIPDSVTAIGACAYSGCTALTSLRLGESLTSIENFSMEKCYGLSSIKFPDSVTRIGDGAFKGDSRVEVFDFGNARTTIPQLANANAFMDLGEDYKIVVPDALYENWSLSSTNWRDDSVRPHIVKWSDYWPLRARFADGPDWIDYVPASDVLDNAALAEVGLKDSEGAWLSAPVEAQVGMRFREVGTSAFEDCSSLSAATIMNDRTKLGQYAFRNCAALQALYPTTRSDLDGLQYFTTGVSSLGGGLLQGSFRGNFRADNMTKLNAQRGSVQYITFFGSKVERLYLPGLLQITGASKCDVFREMTNLKYIYMPNIEACDCQTAFHWLTTGQRVVVDFRRRLSDQVPPLGEDFFKRSQSEYIQPVVVVDDGKKDLWLADEEWSKYWIMEESEYLGGYCRTTASLADGSETELSSPSALDENSFADRRSVTGLSAGASVLTTAPALFQGCSQLSSVETASREIGAGAFSGCDGLLTITLAEGCEKIGLTAFSECTGQGLSVSVADTVKEIGNQAFYGCSGLSQVDFGTTRQTPPQLKGDAVFDQCPDDMEILVPADAADTWKTSTNWAEYADKIKSRT